MKYNFSEKILAPHFREDIVRQIRILVKAGSSFTIIGMPFVGISPFFRYLATTNLAYSVYVDVHALQYRKKEELFASIYKELGGHNHNIEPSNAFDECKKLLRDLLINKQRIVIMINRFDYLDKEEFEKGIFTNLKSLEDIGKGKIIFIVASSKPLYEINEMALYDSNLALFSKIVYFPPYSGKDLEKILLISPIALKPNPKDLNRALYLSGGHATLLQLLLKTEYLENPFEDAFIRLHLKVIYDTCSTKQKSVLKKLAMGKKLNQVEPFLLKIGVINQIGNRYELFSALFSQYINSFVKIKFSKKEKSLFYLLKKQIGKTVTKDDIFHKVWESDYDHATDWALNSLIYRLRKNASFINGKFVIENDKDIGYRMIKEM